MGHDIGSLFAFYLDKKYPNYLESIVALDATPFKPKLNFKQTFLMFTYQWFNIITFLLPNIIGNPMHRFILKHIIKYPYDSMETSANMNYMYFYYWKEILMTMFNKKKS